MELDLNLLQSKLNAVLETPAEDPSSRPVSPSLASTSSEALQYHEAVYREPPTESELARREEKSERNRNWVWVDPEKKKEIWQRNEQAYKRLWGVSCLACSVYEMDTIRLAALRKEEDGPRSDAAGGDAPTWTQNDRRALEFQRQKEDYLDLTDHLSDLVAGDERTECEKILRYRILYLKSLLRLYDSRWRESLRRLGEETDEKKQSQTQDPTGDVVDDSDSKVQGSFHGTLSGREQVDGPVANGSPGLIDSPRASRAAGKEETAPRRRPKIFVDAAEPQPPPVGRNSRRARRTRPPVPSTAEDPAATSSANLSKRVLRPRPGRTAAKHVVATGSSAKPQGVSKKQREKTGPVKARK